MTLDLFADLNKQYPDIAVCAEVYVDVHHCLVGRHAAPRLHQSLPKNTNESPVASGGATPTAMVPHPELPRTSPLRNLGHIKMLYSHPQAWGQCKAFLAAYLKGVERQDVSSTSRAAEIVAQDPTGTSAAISSSIAAKVHGLELLAKGIEDREDNTTRFFVLRRRKVDDNADMGGFEDDASDISVEVTENAAFKSLVSFTVPHEDPGALAAALAVFKNYKLNLTSINARPSGLAPWNYVFFVEFQGRRLKGTEGAVNNALRDLDSLAQNWRWLGSWKSKLYQNPPKNA